MFDTQTRPFRHIHKTISIDRFKVVSITTRIHVRIGRTAFGSNQSLFIEIRVSKSRNTVPVRRTSRMDLDIQPSRL